MQIRPGRLRFRAAPKGWGPHKSGETLQRLPETASDMLPVNPRQRANNNTGFKQVLHHRCTFLFWKQKQDIKNKCRRTPPPAFFHTFRVHEP